jgi:peptidoglycan hydrolase-like protein with peptidoglycan-binding domain
MKRLNQATGSPIRPARTPNVGPTRGSRNQGIVRQFTRLNRSRSAQTQTQPVAVPPHKSPVCAKSQLAEMFGKLSRWLSVIGLILIYFVGQGNAKRIHEGVSKSTEYPNVRPANRQGSTNVSPSGSTGTLIPSQKTLPWPTPNNFDGDGAPPSDRPWIAPEATPGSSIAELGARTLTVPAPAWPLLGLPGPGVPSRAFPAPAFLERWFPEPPSPFPDPALVAFPLSLNGGAENSSGPRSQEGITSIQGETPFNIDIRRLEDAKRIQLRLIELGFFAGTADGIWGPRSRSALKAFRAANQLSQDDAWDAMTEARMFGDTAHADRAGAMGFVGGWAPNLGDCHSGAVGRAPLTITAKRAKTSGGVCEFGSVQRNSDGWRVQAICAAGEKSWNASIRLTPKGNRLTWSNERVTEVFVRCSGSRG